MTQAGEFSFPKQKAGHSSDVKSQPMTRVRKPLRLTRDEHQELALDRGRRLTTVGGSLSDA